MAGRRRRASTSSVESESESDARWRQESSVVRSIPKDKPSDDWPIFELANAIVLGKDGQTIENALHVEKMGPFIVRGHLVIDEPSQKTHQIRKSTLYSIGESDDHRPLIWVSGQGGWYEIDPCRAYRPVYNKMCEATTMYYTLLDIYNERPSKKIKKGKNPTLMDELGPVFHKYAARIGDGSTFEEVVARAREHASFFVDRLSQNDGIFDWTTTAFYKWIKSEHAERENNATASETKQQRSYPSHPSEAQNSSRENARALSRSSSVDVTDGNISQTGRIKRGLARSATPRIVDKHAAQPDTQPSASAADVTARSVVPLYEWSDKDNSPTSPLQSVLATFADCFDALAPSKRGMTLSGTLTRLYFNYTFPTYKDARVGSYKRPVQEWIHYYSKALLHVLDERYRRHEIYTELQELAKTELELLAYKPLEFPPKVITPRKSQPRKGTAGQTPSTPIQTLNNHNYSGSDSPRPMGKRPTRTPGKSSLRPRVPKKRPRNEYESDSPGGSEAPGHARKSHYFDNGEFLDYGMDMDNVQPLDPGDENDADDDIIDPDAQERYDLEPIRLVIRAEKIPESSPRGPDDTWACDQEDCDYIVRGADQEDCQDRIRQHFRDHEQQLTRVNLAMSEGARGHMPIKYAYFPPFLILIYFQSPHCPPPPSRPVISSSYPTSSSAHPLSYPVPPLPLPLPSATPASPRSLFRDIPSPDLSGTSRDRSRALVERFNCNPSPSLPNPHTTTTTTTGNLTHSQSPTRQDQAHSRRSDGSANPADQEEVDSVTLCSDSDGTEHHPPT
ncbi:hypothetical protein EsDP_00005419 [Epichloe bromicola]|uniref:DNA (cytosine-5)-methyltransferase 1 replication foci domain-containing protein n=1 Tax=Epichloe bromicola TaxID=79588 RepID=A0ABQ0CUL5_9HYPO